MPQCNAILGVIARSLFSLLPDAVQQESICMSLFEATFYFTPPIWSAAMFATRAAAEFIIL